MRRRSGKIFGPFDEAQVVEMLSKGELVGNEDVSEDGERWQSIATVDAFLAAIPESPADPAPAAHPAPAARPAVRGEAAPNAVRKRGKACV